MCHRAINNDFGGHGGGSNQGEESQRQCLRGSEPSAASCRVSRLSGSWSQGECPRQKALYQQKQGGMK